MLSTFIASSSPSARPICIALPGSFVCTCTLTTSPSLTTTTQSPIFSMPVAEPRDRRIGAVLVGKRHYELGAVAKRNFLQRRVVVHEVARQRGRRGLYARPRLYDSPLSALKKPASTTHRPLPPESTTPACLSAGSISVVRRSIAVAAAQREAHHVNQVPVGPERGFDILGYHAYDREYRALLGLHYGLICRYPRPGAACCAARSRRYCPVPRPRARIRGISATVSRPSCRAHP